MDQRRNDVAEWVAHLPGLSHTPRQQRKEDRKMSNADETIKTCQEKSKRHSLDPHMVEAMRIYRSEFWESTNISWLFNKEPPEWLDTGQANWSGVKMILQDFKYKDVQRKLSRTKMEIATEQAESSCSDSESTGSYDYPTVRIVSSKGSEQNLKSCLKTSVYLRTNIIKMVIVGSIDIELYSLDEDEIEWKSIPVSLERFEVNGKYIRDISLEEMRVTKLGELGMDVCTDKDKGDYMVAGASRAQLCDLYNKKLQSQMAGCSLERPINGLKYKFPVRQELSELSGHTPKTLLLENSVTRMITRRTFPKPLHDTKDNRVSTVTTEQESERDERRRDVIARGSIAVSVTGSASVRHTLNNVNMGNKRRQSYFGESLTPASSLGDIIDFSGISTDDLLEEAISKCSKETDVKEMYKLKSTITTDEQQKKRSYRGENNKVSLSFSLQSLDELLDDALKSQVEIERRRHQRFSTIGPNDELSGSSVNQQAKMDYASLHGLNRFDKRDDNSEWKPAIDIFDSEEVNINNVCSDGPMVQDCHRYTSRSESFRQGCRSPSGYLEHRNFRAGNSEMYNLSKLDSALQSRRGDVRDLPPYKSCSNVSISSLLSMEDWEDTYPSRSELRESHAEISSTTKRASPYRSSPGINTSDSHLTHSVELHLDPKRGKFLSFINRNVLSFWKKLF